jgi:hypothetical protein
LNTRGFWTTSKVRAWTSGVSPLWWARDASPRDRGTGERWNGGDLAGLYGFTFDIWYIKAMTYQIECNIVFVDIVFFDISMNIISECLL